MLKSNEKNRAGNTGYDTTTRHEHDSIFYGLVSKISTPGQFSVNPKLTRLKKGRVSVNPYDTKLTRLVNLLILYYFFNCGPFSNLVS